MSLDLFVMVGMLVILFGVLIFNKVGLMVAIVGVGDKVVFKLVMVVCDLGLFVELVLGLVVGDCVIENLLDGVVDGDFVCVVVFGMKGG